MRPGPNGTIFAKFKLIIIVIIIVISLLYYLSLYICYYISKHNLKHSEHNLELTEHNLIQSNMYEFVGSTSVFITFNSTNTVYKH